MNRYFRLMAVVLWLLILQMFCMANTTTWAATLPEDNLHDTSVAAAEPFDQIPPLQLIKGPYLQNVKKHSITIMWETSIEASSRVDYGKTNTYGEKIVSEELVKIHEITIAGLEEETIYHYQVSSVSKDRQECFSEDNIFKTAVKDNTPFCFTVYGDNRTNVERHERIADAMVERRPDLVMNVGDVVTDGTNYEQWGREFFEPAKRLFKNTPFYISIGNHEYGREREWFHRFVSFPQPENYYSFDYGNAHFTVIDSQGGGGRGSAQYEWLEEDLKSATATWKFVFFHHAPYCSCIHVAPGRRVLCPIFEKYHVDIVFNGHSHIYERTHPLTKDTLDMTQGVIYVTTGGGGAGLHKLNEKRSYWTAELAGKYHYCLVKIAEKNLQMMVYDIDGKLLDFLTIRK